MTDEELDALCDLCPYKDKINMWGDCSAPKSFSCPQEEALEYEEKEKKMSFMSELLSRCENSDDADKRELVVYVNKLDAIRDSLERQLWMSKNETTRAQNTIAAMKVKLNELKARIKEEDADLQAADDEIDELHEKYRWRKQSEEPAPEGADLEVYIPPCQGDGINGITLTPMLQIFRHGEWDVWPQEYWRPLELPEESK